MGVLRAIKKQHFDALEKNPKWGFTYWAFDLHGTIIKPNYETGNIPREFYPHAKEVLQMLNKRDDIVMYMYTCSHPHEQKQYIEYFEEHGITFKWVNENPDIQNSGYGYYEDKPYFNVLFEDKASFNPHTEWVDIYYFFKDLESTTNSRNEKLFKEFESRHISEGGKVPRETALTNLVNDAIKRRDYRLYNNGGCDINGNQIKKYDVVMWSSLANDPYFMVALDVDEGDQCDLYHCNNNGIIEKKII